MMSLIKFLKNIFKKEQITINPQENELKEQIYTNKENMDEKEIQIISIWDVIKCNEHTQAYHLVSVIPFDEWVSMNEIRRRIWDLFQAEYKNDRSLYPYLKTMVDLGIVETSNIGGKRKWRKRDLLIKKEEKKNEREEISIKQPLNQ